MKTDFMYSGCGIQNEKGAFSSLPKEALIFYYTAALSDWTDSSKTKFTIRYAYSLDGGKSLIKSGEPVLESLYPDNRDPKVFWHEKSKAYIMVLWLQENDFGIFRSEDMEHFELSQRITLEGGYECPDLFCLPVYEETGRKIGVKWVFWAADSSYYVGSFDGFIFTQEQKRQKANGINSMPYAAQTFSGTDEVISMAWLCTKCIGLSTTGVISLPRTLSLVKTKDQYQIRQKLPEVVEQGFIEIGKLEKPGEGADIPENGGLRLLIKSKEDWTLEFFTKKEEIVLISYECASGNFIITYRDVSTFVLMGGTSENLELVYDKGIFEISGRDGRLLNISDLPELRTQIVKKVILKEGIAQIVLMSTGTFE